MGLPPIIVVDDNPEDLGSLGTGLQERYCNPVVAFFDAESAMEFLRENMRSLPPCAIVTDMALPGTHGLELLQWCKRQPELSAAPIVAVTATPDLTGLVALRMGACAVIPKPVSVRAIDQFFLSRNDLTIVSGVEGKAALFTSGEDALRALSGPLKEADSCSEAVSGALAKESVG